MPDHQPGTVVRPTSFAQQSLWQRHQLDPDQPTCHLSVAARIRGPLDPTLLEEALNRVVGRHEVLRTVFEVHDGTPMQVIVSSLPVAIPMRTIEPVDLQPLVHAEVRRPFDLAHGPLLRVRLLRLGEHDHVVLCVMHQIVADDVSSTLLFDELVGAYERLVAGERPTPPKPALQYADFAVRQRQRLDGGTLPRLTEFWTDTVAGAAPLVLPFVRSQPGAPADHGAVHRFAIPGDLVTQLERLALKQDADLFTALLTGFDVLLARYSGQVDIAVSTPTTGRTRPELEGILGHFANPVLLRADLDGDPTFAELLNRVRHMNLAAFDHQEMPYGLVCELARGNGDRAPGQVLFVLRDSERPHLRSANLEIEWMDLETGTAKADLVLDVEPGAGDYAARLEYHTDLLDRSVAELMVEDLLRVLTAMSADPDRSISTVAMAGGPHNLLGRPVKPRRQAPVQNMAPRTPLEAKVAAIWSEVLQREAVGVHDDFFDCGGRPLLAERLAERLRDELGVHLAMRELDTGFTITDITRLLADRTAETAQDPHQPIPTLPRGPGEQWFPAAVSQEGMWRGIVKKGGPALAIASGLRILGELDTELVEAAWNTVIARHETLRTALVERDGRLMQVIAEPGRDPVPVTPIRALHEFAAAAMHEVDRPFPLARRPLARLRLFRLAEDDHIALLLTHHIISDARTLEVLVRDLAVAYAAAATGTALRLPPLKVQWVEFAAWHRQRLAGPRGAQLIRYWSERLNGAVPVNLPSDVEPPPEQDLSEAQRGDMLVTALTPMMFELVSELAQRYRVTLYVLGFVAFTVVLARRSGQRDIAVNVPISYRDRSELGDLVADFSNDLIVRSDLSANPTLAELIDATRGRLAEDFAHHDLPPHLLAGHVGGSDLMDRLADVLFIAERELEVSLQVGSLRLEPCYPSRQYVTRPLAVRLRHDDNGAQLIVRYRANRFTGRRIAELVHDFLDLFREMADHPEHRVFDADRAGASPDRPERDAG